VILTTMGMKTLLTDHS